MYDYEQNFLLHEAFTTSVVPKMKRDKSPSSLMLVKEIGHQESDRILRVLFDSGGSHTLIHRSVLPIKARLMQAEMNSCATAAGTFQVKDKVRLRKCFLPEFDKTKRIYGINAGVFDAPCNYDVILGRDFLSDIGIKMDFETRTMQWMDRTVNMKFRNELAQSEIQEIMYEDFDPWLMDDDEEQYLLDAKYESKTPAEIASAQKHLTLMEQRKLEDVLSKVKELFDGSLGHYNGGKIKLELEDGAVPFHSKAYSIPISQQQAFKKELQHLVEIGVLSKAGPSEWAAPTFCIPKKDGRIRWLTDFRALNKNLRRHTYPLPLIDEIVRRRKGYKYFTKLDLSMMYYAFELDERSKDLCTIVTPYGKYKYNRMAMGLKVSPDYAQYHIEKVLDGLDVEVYIDDVGIFSDDYDEHLKLVSQVLARLEQAGLRVNPLKCEWGVQETDFLGHWLTPEGVKPWKKKIDAILKMRRPRDLTQLRAFLGAVTYYRHMWPRRSHLLAPLTELTGKAMFEWTPQCTKAFEEMKAVMASEVLMHYPNPNLPYDLYTDASDYQMGAVIMQQGKPIAYWSRKLNEAQKNYSVMEKEMLAVVMCLKEYRSLLYGSKLTVYTDHKNLTFRTLNAQRVLRWRMYLEEFGPTFKYCPGKDNVIADCFSRLPRMEKPSEGKSVAPKGKLIAFEKLTPPKNVDDEIYLYEDTIAPPTARQIQKEMPCRFSCCKDVATISEDSEMLEAFLNHPEFHAMQNPITMLNIHQHQMEDERLNALRVMPGRAWQFPVKWIQDKPIICYKVNEEDDEVNWRIALPATLAQQVIRWYHEVLGHPGATKLYDTISRRFYVPGLKKGCEEYKCAVCQKNKLLGRGYGHLPPRHAQLVPWNEVAVDLIGPWKIMVNNVEVEFNALTCIDPVTNLVEIIRLENKTAKHVSEQFENCWLARYPRPNKCIHDNGGEFIGNEFQLMLQRHGIKDVPTTSRNPQGNSVCERMHQSVANVLRTILNDNRAQNQEHAVQAVENALATTMYATRCSVSRALDSSPGELVFRRDMFVDIPVMVDLLTIQEKRQVMIDNNLRRQNEKRREFQYQVGGEVLIKAVDPSKMQEKAHGPYVITQVYTNGTVDVQRNHNVVERLNIRRLVPFFRR